MHFPFTGSVLPSCLIHKVLKKCLSKRWVEDLSYAGFLSSICNQNMERWLVCLVLSLWYFKYQFISNFRYSLTKKNLLFGFQLYDPNLQGVPYKWAWFSCCRKEDSFWLASRSWWFNSVCCVFHVSWNAGRMIISTS
jgi:hypothetical protein